MLKTLAVFGLLLLFVSPAAAQGSSGSWLRGSWEGTGYQTDDNSTWAMKLTVAKRKNGRQVFKIDYPSLNCGGRWKLLSSGQNVARFREVLDHGVEKCSNNGSVTIERKAAQLVFLYRNQGDRELTSSAILNRSKKIGRVVLPFAYPPQGTVHLPARLKHSQQLQRCAFYAAA